MNIKLSTNNKTYRGEIIERTDAYIVLRDAITLKNVKINLVLPFSIESYLNGGDVYLSRELDYIKSANSNALFSVADKSAISQSDNVCAAYMLLHGLRDLGLTCNCVEDIDLAVLKNNVRSIFLKQYENHLAHLPAEQTDNSNQIANKVFDDYSVLLSESDSAKDVLAAWPTMFTNQLQYNSYLVMLLT